MSSADGPPARRRRWTRQPALRSVPVAAVVIVAVLGAGLASREAARTADRASALEAVLGTLEARFAASHVWVEERVAGDRTVNVRRDIVGNQDEAARLCRIMQNGGFTGRGRVESIDDARLTPLVGQTCSGIRTFSTLTAGRLARPRAERPGSPADTRFDQTFVRVLSSGDAARVRLQAIARLERARTQRALGAIALLLCVLVIAAGVLIQRRERQLSDMAAERETLLQSAGAGILAIGVDGTLQFVNKAAADMLGWPSEELTGRVVGQVLPPDDLAGPGDPLAGWLRVESPARGDDRSLLRRNGTSFPIAHSLSPANASSDDGRVVLTFQDIELRRQLEQRKEAELAELRVIRETLVPSATPNWPGLELATCHVAAQDGVAGDFYLLTDGPRGSKVIMVGDVAGKGLQAAKRAAYLRAALATFADYEDSPRRLLELGNRSLMHATGASACFVTLMCMVVRPSGGSLSWASAGHPPPISLGTGVALECRPSLPLGLAPALDLDEQEFQFEAGAGLLLHTDGLSEARPPDPDPELLGTTRVGALMREHAGSDPSVLAHALRSLAEVHSGGRLADDLCMVILRRTSQPASSSPD